MCLCSVGVFVCIAACVCVCLVRETGAAFTVCSLPGRIYTGLQLNNYCKGAHLAMKQSLAAACTAKVIAQF